MYITVDRCVKCCLIVAKKYNFLPKLVPVIFVSMEILQLSIQGLSFMVCKFLISFPDYKWITLGIFMFIAAMNVNIIWPTRFFTVIIWCYKMWSKHVINVMWSSSSNHYNGSTFICCVFPWMYTSDYNVKFTLHKLHKLFIFIMCFEFLFKCTITI